MTPTPILSLCQCFGEAIHVAPLTTADITQVVAATKSVSLSVWYDSDLTKVAVTVKQLHGLGCKVTIKRHVDRADQSNPYRLSYYRMPWFYAQFAARVRNALAGVLQPGDAIEIANEPAYTKGDTDVNGNQIDYFDDVAVWRDLFAAIALEDRQAFPGVEIIGPLPNGQTPESVEAILNGTHLSVAAFQPFDSVSAHLYPNGQPVGARIAQLAAFSKWSGKPVRITECGGPVAGALAWIQAVMTAASVNRIASVDWWSWIAPPDGFSLDLKANPQLVKAIVSPLVAAVGGTTAGPGTTTPPAPE